MYSIIIVDDESLIRKGLRHTIKWDKLGFNVVDEAVDGEMALEKIRSGDFDVVLSDIRMPVINGLELSNIISNEFPEMKIVIISGYSEFEYARSALESNVFSYILKPVKEEVVNEVFTKLKQELDREKRKTENSNTNLMCARNYILRQLINHELKDSKSIYEILNGLFEYQENEEYVIIYVKIINLNEFLKKNFDQNIRRLLVCFYNSFKSQMFTLMNDAIVILIRENEIESSVSLIKNILENNMINTKYYVGIGNSFTDIKLLALSYVQALQAVQYVDKKTISYYKKLKHGGFKPKENLHELKINLIHEIEKGNTQNILHIIDDIFLCFSNRYYEKSLNWCANLIYEINKHYEVNMEQNIFESLNGKLDAIKNEQDIVQLKSWFSQEISNIMNILIEITKDNSIALLKKTKQIIINEYSDYNISLQSIADRLNISPGYLSSLFKKVTGENFTNYLISIRMEKAIKHILVGREKVFEIAEKVGYSSARYFNDAFKKRFGVSPLEYKKRIGSNEKSV